MATYLVRPDDKGATATLINGANALMIEAASPAEAEEVAENINSQGLFVGDVHFESVDVSTILSAAKITAKSNGWEGWEWKVDIEDVTPVTYTGVLGDTVPTIAGELVTKLNALTAIANAAWNLSALTLTIAGAADDLGNKEVDFEIIPPGSTNSLSTLTDGVAITDQGVTGAALSADLSVLVADVAAVGGQVPLKAMAIRIVE